MLIGSLNDIEIRVIGALIEKEITTPEYYPLSINALINACNQKSNRNPVVNYDEQLVHKTIESLREKKLVMRRTGDDMRVPKYRQTFTDFYHLIEPETAVMTILFLRGAQTPGEIRSRCGRIHNFENMNELEEILKRLMQREEPFVKKLQRQSGMKESRYDQLFCTIESVPENHKENSDIQANPDLDRIAKLEERVVNLENEMSELRVLIDLLTK